MKGYDKTILVTGGCGFIGSELVRQLVTGYPNYYIVNLDALTYAGNPENLKDIELNDNYKFIHGDIRDSRTVSETFSKYDVTDVIHMAAESHVDRSMVNPTIFADTNVMGTVVLLNVARDYWKDDYSSHRFINMGTDEIFGALGPDDDRFTESTPFNPHSPYSTSKTSQVLFGKTYWEAYGVPVINMASTNAIGPYQFPEKLVPLTYDRIITNEKIPVYGKGEQIRDWLFVSDFASALIMVLHNGVPGELYCIGGDSERSNIDMIHTIMKCIAEYKFNNCESKWIVNPVSIWVESYKKNIEFIPDPRGKSHDFRYGIDHSKITRELGWKPTHTFEESVKETVKWYFEHKDWIERCKSGEYLKWIDTYYNEKQI